MNAAVPAARRWKAALVMSLLALAPAHAAGQATRAEIKAEDQAKSRNGIVTMEVSFQDFVELQRLDEDDRRLRLGLPASCSPSITAMTGAISPTSRFFVVVICNATTED